MASLVGVDGCHDAWFAASLDVKTGEIVSEVFATPNHLCDSYASAVAIAVDVPIGLTDSGQRDCDREARKRLGRPRASSVFPAPLRAVLEFKTREEASRTQKSIDGCGMGGAGLGNSSQDPRVGYLSTRKRSDCAASV